ncbi:hypothetical protein E2C01_013028 [Portunus trituberculatus]|uniref:Uncharacterized protein n=1 Tax=Portunus trituberculatus TaxID=210409 RepID=A0A5B7DG05_PORTR|nr:hypothetical protein [Portunus trituberculatus]
MFAYVLTMFASLGVDQTHETGLSSAGIVPPSGPASDSASLMHYNSYAAENPLSSLPLKAGALASERRGRHATPRPQGDALQRS